MISTSTIITALSSVTTPVAEYRPILEYLKSIHLSDYLSLLALTVSVFALGWNIVRDIWLERVKIDVSAGIGGYMLYQDGSKGFFRDVDSKYNPENKIIRITMTNTGRRPVMLSKIQGEYINPTNGNTVWILTARHLPKFLQPYEFLIETIEDPNVIKDIHNIKNISVIDTKGYSWKLDDKYIEKIKKVCN
jgi:hypothetical protein